MNEADDAMTSLAESIIDEVLSDVVKDRREEVNRALATLAAAQRGLVAADLDLSTWRRRREFGHTIALKALQAAQVADFVPSAVPPGMYTKAVTNYLKAHPPIWQVPRNDGPLNAIRRASSAALKAARRPLLTRRRK